MTNEEIDRLTIAEVRAISERASDALSRFREVQSMLGAPLSVPAAHSPPPGSPSLLQGVIQTNKGSLVLSPEERARKLALPAFQANGEPVIDGA